MRHPYVISSGELESLHLQGQQQRTGQSVQIKKRKEEEVARWILGDTEMDGRVFVFIGESML